MYVWPPSCDMLRHVGCCWLNFDHFKLEPTTPNMSQHGGQHVAPNNVAICCVAMLRSFGRGLTSFQIYTYYWEFTQFVMVQSCNLGFCFKFFHRFRHVLVSLVSEAEHVTKTMEKQPFLVNVYLAGREHCVK